MRVGRILIILITWIGGLLVAVPEASAVDLAEIVDLVRTRHCGDQSIPGRPLRASMELDIAAGRMAEGQELETAIAEANYRARSSASISLRAPRGRNDVIAKTLAESFCHVLTNPEFVDIGVYRNRERALLIFADGAPLPRPDDGSLADELLALVNTLRSESRNCGNRRFDETHPLKRSTVLQKVATLHANDMASNGFLDHVGSDGRGPSERASAEHYAWQRIAENVAAGQTNPEDVAATWIASPAHCANLMDPRTTETGIGYSLNPGDSRSIYWVQIYALPK